MKYETARKLKGFVGQIRKQYTEDLKSKETRIRQRWVYEVVGVVVDEVVGVVVDEVVGVVVDEVVGVVVDEVVGVSG